MKLPEWLNQQVWHEIETLEEGAKLQYITSVERIGIAKGRVEGRVEGLLEGRLEGLVEGESKLLRRLLERRFGDLPAWVSAKMKGALEQELESWGEAVLTAPTLEAVFDKSTTH